MREQNYAVGVTSNWFSNFVAHQVLEQGPECLFLTDSDGNTIKEGVLVLMNAYTIEIETSSTVEHDAIHQAIADINENDIVIVDAIVKEVTYESTVDTDEAEFELEGIA